MPRRISSQLIFLYKFVFPGLLIAALLMLVFFGEWSVRPPTGIEIVGTWLLPIGGLILMLWLAWRLKSVSLDEHNLYVSTYRRSITIPLSEIANVREFILSEPRIVTISLRSPSEFGQKIVFLAPYRMFAFWHPHPLVDELLQFAVSNGRFPAPASGKLK